ncbi:MAG: hypothetical protein V1784_10045, partial [bacterium]
EEIAHLALLQHKNPKRVLLLGGGISGTANEILKYQPERIDYIELDPSLVEMAQKYLPQAIKHSLEAPSVNLIVTDGRKFLRHTNEMYDAILIDMPEPTSGSTNRFYTREFFANCANRLRADGIIAFRLPSAEQYWTPNLARRNTSIYRAVKAAFSDVITLPGTENIFIASNASLTRNPEIVAQRFQERNITARLIHPLYIRYLYTNDRFAEIEKTLHNTIAPTNSDLKPICYQLTLLVWLSRFYRPIADFQIMAAGWIWLLLIPFAFVFWMIRKRIVVSKLFLIALAGFAGMVIEFAVLLRFQTASGILFRDIGLLLAGFMAGLAMSPMIGRWAAGRTQGGQLLVGSLGILCFTSAFLFHWDGMRYTITGVAWLFLTGCNVGALFCYATEKIREKGASFYAADLLGGSIGALIGSIILLPSLGLDIGAIWVGSIVVSGMILSTANE